MSGWKCWLGGLFVVGFVGWPIGCSSDVEGSNKSMKNSGGAAQDGTTSGSQGGERELTATVGDGVGGSVGAGETADVVESGGANGGDAVGGAAGGNDAGDNIGGFEAAGGTSGSDATGGTGGTAATGGTGGTGGPQGTPGTIELTGGKLHIMPLGDSITLGVEGGYRNDLYTALTSDGFAVDMVGTQYDTATAVEDKDHEGHPGYTIRHGLYYLSEWLAAIKTPDVVLVMLGTNDIATWTTLYPVEIADEMVALVGDLRLKVPDAVLIVATIPPMPSGNVEPVNLDRAEMTTQYNKFVKSKLAAHPDHGTKVFVADVNAVLTLDDLYDGYHPSAKGHAKIAAAFYDVMDDLLPAAP